MLDLLLELRYNGDSFLSMIFAELLPRCGSSACNLNRTHGVVISPDSKHVTVAGFDDITGAESEPEPRQVDSELPSGDSSLRSE